MESSAYVPVVLDIADDSEPLLQTVSEAVDVKEINTENLNETVAKMKKHQPVAAAHASTSNDRTTESKPVVFTNIPEPSEPDNSAYSSTEYDFMNDYSSMIEGARKLREDVMAGVISDEVRRNRAADFALKFAQAMNFDEESSDDDDSR